MVHILEKVAAESGQRQQLVPVKNEKDGMKRQNSHTDAQGGKWIMQFSDGVAVAAAVATAVAVTAVVREEEVVALVGVRVGLEVVIVVVVFVVSVVSDVPGVSAVLGRDRSFSWICGVSSASSIRKLSTLFFRRSRAWTFFASAYRKDLFLMSWRRRQD